MKQFDIADYMINVQILEDGAITPVRAHETDAGLDIFALEHVMFRPGEIVIVKTGIAVEIPVGCVGLIMDRSSLAAKGLKIAGGVIDSGYTGELKIVFHNISDNYGHFKAGQKCAQLIILPIKTPAANVVASLTGSLRGTGGFGSTGE